MNGSVFCFNRTAATLKASIYIFLSLCLHLAKLFMTIVYMLIAFAIPHMSGVSQGRSLYRSLVPFQQFHLFAGLSLSLLVLQYSSTVVASNHPKWPCFPFCSSRKKTNLNPIHPSIPGQTSQSILEDTLLIRGARFFFVRKTKQEKRKKKEKKL